MQQRGRILLVVAYNLPIDFKLSYIIKKHLKARHELPGFF